jgi:hypothetical protein
MSSVLDAMRTTVKQQIIEFKDRAFSVSEFVRCEITGELLTRDKCHVDHITPFVELATSFLADRGLTPNDSMLIASADNQYLEEFVDEDLAIDWFEYHLLNAELRIVSAKANMTRKRKESV